jgi:hypothetical protein
MKKAYSLENRYLGVVLSVEKSPSVASELYWPAAKEAEVFIFPLISMI